MAQEPQPPLYLAKITCRSHSDGREMQGSAVFIAPSLLITCRHVVHHKSDAGPAKEILVHIPGRQPIPATVLKPTSEKPDLALLQLKTPARGIPIPPWSTLPSLPENERVYALGYPGGTYRRSPRRIHSFDDGRLVLQGDVEPGSSGGVVEYWDHPVTCCVALIDSETPLVNTRAITRSAIDRFLQLHNDQLPPRPRDPITYLEYLRKKTGKIELGALNVGAKDVYVDIDKLWVPTRIRTLSAPETARQEIDAQSLSVVEALNRSRVLVVEGEAGSGKSTLIRRIVYALVRDDQDNETLGLEFRNGFPLWLQVTVLESFLAKHYPDGPPKVHDIRWLEECLADQGAQRGWCLDESYFAEKLGDRDSILLLDGLDEASGPWRPVLAQLFDEASSLFPCRMVLTMRPEAEHSKRLITAANVVRLQILEMDDPEVEAFLQLWIQHVPSHDTVSARTHAECLRTNLASRPAIRRMARNPLMLTILAALSRRSNRLPEQRAALFERIVRWLAESRYLDENDVDTLLRNLSFLALHMVRRKTDKKYQISYAEAGQTLASYLQAPDTTEACDFLAAAERDSGLITERGGELAFWHRSFQEYLAASALAGMLDADRNRAVIELMDGRQSPEVLRLLAGCLQPRASDRLTALFQLLIDGSRPSTGGWFNDLFGLTNRRAPKLEQLAYSVGIIGGMLADLAPTPYQLPPEVKNSYDALRRSVTRIFQRGEAEQIALSIRIAAAEALALGGGDDRLRLPSDPRYWVKVPGGSFVMGAQKHTPGRDDYDPDAQGGEDLGGKLVDVAPFCIGRYPVTVHEYGEYLDQAAITPSLDLRWEEQQEHPSLPVVRVTMDEAKAYCHWAGGRLPTEMEWEFAARGPGKHPRKYPWGNERPTPDRADYAESGAKGLTPVGLFPSGATPADREEDRIFDLAGNVWEWVEGERRLRGGSFDVGASFLRASFRDVSLPAVRYDNIGFRCARDVFP